MTSRFMRAGIIAAGAIFLSAFAAQAADLRATNKAPAYAPAAISSSWNGFYVGLNAGYGFGNSDVAITPDATLAPAFAAGALPSTVGLSPKGFIGGAQIGYNYQWGSSWLLGAEGDIQYSAIKDSKEVDISGVPGFVPSVTTAEHKMDWFGTARLRAGYLISEPWLIYGTGGLAVGHVKDTVAFGFPTGAGTQTWAGSSTATKIGWTLGGGVEWAFMSRWTAKAEYLYYSLGSNSVDIVATGTIPATASASFPLKGSIARLGVNYRF